jgi:hypothetical protein
VQEAQWIRPIGTGTLLAENWDIVLPMWICVLVKDMLILVILECFFFSCNNNFNAFMDHQYACGKMSFDKTILYFFRL